MWSIILLTIIAYLSYSYYKYATFWKSRGVPSIWPVPILGNVAGGVFRKRAIAHIIEDVYMAFPENRYAGFFNSTIPSLMIRDPDLLKKIMVKEFDTFPEHREFIPDGVDPLWSKNLFAMRGGKKWQEVRSTLSPSFTSSKMKMMFNLIKECSTKFGDHFSKSGETVIVEMKDVFTKFTNDVIATSAFGVSCDSLENPKNEFYFHGLKITKFTGFQGLKFFFYIICPTIMKMLKIAIFPEESQIFFTNVIDDAIKLRREKSIVRHDMIHLLMEANKGSHVTENELNEDDSGFAVVKESNHFKQRSKTGLSDEDIVAQALIFFFAGFDTSSTMMSHAAYELALNPDTQDKLRKEVDETLEKFNGETTYEGVIGMKYLDMVISETLRKWPPFIMNDRRAIRPFVIEPERPGEKRLQLDAGQIYSIPVYGIQRDPLHFPNPDKFDPERFSDENKHNIKPFTYLPFGAGPRNCIGSRFALLEGKLILFEIIRKFEIIPVEKTKIPLEMSKRQFNPIPEEGFWLGLKPRHNK